MKRIFTLIAILFIVINTTNAALVTIEEASIIAKNAYYTHANIQNKTPYESINFTSPLIEKEKNIPVYYIFNTENKKGFVIVSAEDQTIPILGYSFENSWNPHNIPDGLIDLMNFYKNQINFMRENGLSSSENVNVLWQYYSTPTLPAKDIQAVLPLLTTTWDQGCYYNAQCPIDASGYCNRVPTGCGATAQAQIMKYHNYPTTGTGSHSYSSPYGTLSANFGTTTYNWGSMPNNVSSSNSSVATLMYHCGVAVDMDYDANGSGSLISDHQYALINYFGYKNTASVRNKSSYTNSGWASLIKGNLDLSLPIFYTGFDNGGSNGHAFVIDGYQGSGLYTDYFHVNWGWSGSENGYYYLNDLTPAPGGIGGGSYDFSYYNSMIINIEPNSVAPPPSGGCDTVTNVGDTEDFTYYSFGGSTWGFWTGHNGYGFSRFADKFTTSNTEIEGIFLAVAKSHAANANSKITAKVWQTGTLPGTTLCSKDEYINNIDAGYWNYIQFTTPYISTGNFYAGFEIYYTYADTFAIYNAELRGAGQTNTAYTYYSSAWHPYPDASSDFTTSLAMYVAVCDPSSGETKIIPVNDNSVIFPNPANDIINIGFGAGTGNTASVFIYDYTGKILYENIYNDTRSGPVSIQTSHLPEGLYIIRIESAGNITSKVISIIR